jgi:acyl-CoA reductase-like NAD-dependent aldehyde dehydrogenase
LREIVSISPVDGSVVGRFDVSEPADVQRMADGLRAAAPAWAATPLRERLRRLRELREVLAEGADRFANVLACELGKPATEAYGSEILPTLEALRWLESNTGPTLRATSLRRFPRRSVMERMPFGVVGALTPWNYPLYLAATSIAWALAAGNTVLWKPSELAPACAGELYSALRWVGLGDAVRLAQGGVATGEAVVSARCDKYVLIGSEATGRRVLARLGEQLRPAVAELSGTDAFLVLADADVERAARSAVWGRCINAGQTCMAPKRILVAQPIYDRFLERVGVHLRRLRVGPDGEIGPLRTPALRETALDAIAEAVERGARLVEGGRTLPGGGCFLQPTLIADCRDEMRLFREDVFGPVLAVSPAGDGREARRRLADGPRMLTASVWTRDQRAAAELARGLDASVVSVNDVLRPCASPAVPFGGGGESGFGRMRGREGLLEMTRTRVTDFGPPLAWPDFHLYPHPPGTADVLRRIAGLAGPARTRLGQWKELAAAARRFGKESVR